MVGSVGRLARDGSNLSQARAEDVSSTAMRFTMSRTALIFWRTRRRRATDGSISIVNESSAANSNVPPR
jgi:hypothetical protein